MVIVNGRIVSAIQRNVTDVVLAYLIAFISTGGDLMATAQIILAIKLNVFAIPLSYTPVMGRVELWVWYVIAVVWLCQIFHRSGYSAQDIASAIDESRWFQ